MSYELAMILVILAALLGSGMCSGLFLVLRQRYIQRTIERKYPDYLRARRNASLKDKEAVDYHQKYVFPYEKQIEDLERKLRWLPKMVRDETVQEIEDLKTKRYTYYLNYEARLDVAAERWEQVEAIKNAHPFLVKHG